MRQLAVVFVVFACAASVRANEPLTVRQSDWSHGPGAAGPVAQWDGSFADSDGVSWRALPGQLALASRPLAVPATQRLGSGFLGALKAYADDVDGDGDCDVLGAAFYADSLALWLNQGGEPISWQMVTIADDFLRPAALTTCDLDQDGRVDILAGAGEGAELGWWRNRGGSPPAWERVTIATAVHGAHDVAGADVDGDGVLDVVAAAWEDDELAWWGRDGDEGQVWTKYSITLGFDYPCNLDVEDMDNDGDQDVVATAWNDQEIAWWRNDGGQPPEWTRQTIASGFAGTHWVHCTDIDGDGLLDVAGAAMDRAELAWWRNDGGNPITWQMTSVTRSLAGAVSVHGADLDGDGDIDLAGAGWSATSGGVAWFESLDGHGTDWQRHTVELGFAEASSVHAADINGDGALDLVASSWARNQLAWWRVSEFVDQGVLVSSVLDAAAPVRWQTCSLIASEAPGSWLGIQARASDDSDDLGAWVELGSGPTTSMDGIAGRFVQYRLSLGSDDPAASVIISEVELTGEIDVAPPPRLPSGRVGRP